MMGRDKATNDDDVFQLYEYSYCTVELESTGTVEY